MCLFFKTWTQVLKKCTMCTGLCRMIAEDACYRFSVLLGHVSLPCFCHKGKEVARALLADILLQKQILLLKKPWDWDNLLCMLWFVLLHLPWDSSAAMVCSFSGALSPWLLSLGCTQVWQAHVVAQLEGTCRVAVGGILAGGLERTASKSGRISKSCGKKWGSAFPQCWTNRRN